MPARLTPTGTKPHSRRIEGTGRVWTGRSRLLVTPDIGVFYEDTGTCILTLSGSGTESHSKTDTGTGTLTRTGSVPNESNTHAGISDFQDLSTIEFTLSSGARVLTGGYTASYAQDAYGTVTEWQGHTMSGIAELRLLASSAASAYPGAFYPGQVYPGQVGVQDVQTHTGTTTATLTFTGTSSEQVIYDATGTATLTLTGSGTESTVHSGTSVATLTLSGTGTESHEQGGNVEYNDSGTAILALSGSRSETHTHTGTRTVTFTLSGSGSVAPDTLTLEEILTGWIASASGGGHIGGVAHGRIRQPLAGSVA